MTYLKVKVHASSKEPRLIKKSTDTYELHVREPAENGRANRAALARLATELGVQAGRLFIIKGAHSPSKIIAIRD
jgi:uncharacterized protein YggU (UPF0235/DUF167 family)